MKSWISSNFKWFIAVSTVLVIMAAVPTTSEAGRRWTGADPEFEVNGHKMNIWVYWETEHTCDLRGPIDVVVAMPQGADYEFKGESEEEFDCDGDGRMDTKVSTKTVVKEYDGRKVVVGAKFNAPDAKFHTALVIKKDDRTASKCRGVSNEWFRCKGIKF